MNQPPAGTLCVDCGCCPAQLYADKDPICWACDAGEPCQRERLRLPATAQSQPPTFPSPREDKPVKTNRISDEVKAAIIAAAPTVSNMDLARQYKISDATVCTLRKKAGIVLVRTHKTVTPTLDASSIVKKSNDVKFPSPVSQPAIETAQAPRFGTVAVTLNFTPDQLDAVWRNLPVAVKAVAITAALETQVKAA